MLDAVEVPALQPTKDQEAPSAATPQPAGPSNQASAYHMEVDTTSRSSGNTTQDFPVVRTPQQTKASTVEAQKLETQ